MIITISILLAIPLLLTFIMLILSTGKPKPTIDANGKPLSGSISEKTFIDINGTKQGMFINGKDTCNPVLLYHHGGMPDYILEEKYPTGMEDYFIMVWWEQHGSGISHSRDIPSETMNQEQMISDIKEVTEYLLRRFHKLKIYLMGHSGIMQNFSKIMLHFFLPNVVIFDVSLINNKMKSQTDLMPVRIVKTA